ncbi:MAG: hypothetical protein MJ051_00055 [Akkermansia sp.]|nr:hypothetical protein [Akkermansia sp.]
MIRRCRPVDRLIALQLCRAAQNAQNGGVFPNLLALSDAELGAYLNLPPRHVQRLRRGGSPLWRCEGDSVQLFFHGAPAAADAREVTPKNSGKRLARHRSFSRFRETRQAGRRQLLPPPAEYPAPEADEPMAADEDEL